MPKRYRLSRADFTVLAKLKSRKIHSEYFSCSVYSLPKSMPGPRAATVVSKKAAQKAVRRNSIERKCRAALQKRLATLPNDVAIIVYAKKEAVGRTMREIDADIATLFERLV